MKLLLSITALIEALTGLSLVVVPSVTASLLLGSALTEPSGILITRIAGSALIALAVSCWLSRDNSQASIPIIKALTVYNISAALLLVYAGLVEHFSGLGLWPAVVLHAALLVWCFQSLRTQQ